MSTVRTDFDSGLVLRALADATPDLIYALDLKGRYLFVSEPAARVLGFSPEEMIGRTWLEIGLPPEREEEFVVERERVLATGIPSKREVSFPTPTGVRWFEYVISPLIDENGGRHGVLAVSRDITSRIAMERDLHAELRFRQTVERSLAPGLLTVDLTGRITYVSESFEKMVGFSASDLRGSRAPYPHWPPEEQGALLDRIEAVKLGRPLPRRSEVTFVRRTGERFPALVETSPLVDEKGTTIGWLAVITDITERQRIAAAVAESDRRYRDLADAMPQIVWSASADGTVEYLNARWYTFSGFATGSLDWTAIIHAEDRERTMEAWRRSLATGEPFQVEYRFLDRQSGEYRWYLGRALPIRDDRGTVIRWYGTATDIEDLKDAQTAVQRQNVFLKTLLDISQLISAELDLHKLVQSVTDAATQVIGAQFGAFFYNLIDERGESYTLYTISGVPREAFSRFPMPRNTAVFGPTFHGTSIVRSDDIRKDPRYGRNAPYYGMPEGHLPVVSYLAVPVVSKSSGRVLGGLFFGHSRAGVFTEDAERLVVAIAAQAAIAMDNANLLEATRRAEERYRTLVSATSQVVWSADSQGNIVAGSGADAAAIEGSAAEWADRMQHDAPFEIEQRVRMKDGSYRWFAIRGFPVGTGGESREWIGIASDIDDRKRGEEAASFLVDASAVLNSSLDAETILSRLGTLAVPRLADWCAIDLIVTGAKRKRVVVAHPDPEKRKLAIELDRDYPPDPARDPIAEVARTGKSQLVESMPEGYLESVTRDARHLELVRALGLRSWIIVAIKAAGAIIGTLTLVSAESARRFTDRDLAVAEDVAERAGVAVYNAQLYRAAQDANRAKDEFLATLSHELRTPMTAILGWARLVNMGAGDEATAREAMHSIEKSARAQSQLIDDLLDISRIGAGKLHLEIEVVDLQEIVRSAVDAVRPAANAKRVELQMALGDQTANVNGDANRLQQVVWNLVSNAVKFTPTGGRVLVTMSKTDGFVKVRVEDTGEGIAPEVLPFIFDRFRQADSSTTRRFGGLGLGLAIVKQLTELHGGQVSVSSAGAGRGAAFTISLPVSSDFTASARTNGGGLQRIDDVDVLVVDDDPEARRYVAATLEHAGARVRVVGSAAEALSAIRRAMPDVLLSDIAMPHRDGYALIEDIRGMLRVSEEQMPAIAMTAFGRTEDRVRILAAGFQRYLMKPVEPDELTRIVAEVARKTQ